MEWDISVTLERAVNPDNVEHKEEKCLLFTSYTQQFDNSVFIIKSKRNKKPFARKKKLPIVPDDSSLILSGETLNTLVCFFSLPKPYSIYLLGLPTRGHCHTGSSAGKLQ